MEMTSRRHAFMIRKRTLLMVLLLLTGGAIINVAVAWFTSWAAQWPTLQLHDNPAIRHWPQTVPPHWPALKAVRQAQLFGWTLTRYASSQFSPKVFEGDATPEQLHASSAQVRISEWFLIDYYDFGWPSRSLHAERWTEDAYVDSRPMKRTEGHPVPSLWRNGYRARTVTGCLPFGPRWPGFAINTVFYAAVLWLLFAAPGKVRRIIRGRRGQCPACAYPVGTSEVCTECGCSVSFARHRSSETLRAGRGEGRGEGART